MSVGPTIMSSTATLLIIIAGAVLGFRTGTTSQTTSSDTVELDVYGDSGTFLSPGYPKQYSNNLNLTYTAYLTTCGPLTVRLYIELDLYGSSSQSCFDYVKIGSICYCGTGTAITEVEVSGNQLSLLFVSDGAHVHDGFNITYTVIQETTTEQGSSQSATEASLSPTSGDSSVSSDDTRTFFIVTSTTDIQPSSDMSVETGHVTSMDISTVTSGLTSESESDWLLADVNSEDSLTSEITEGDVSGEIHFRTSSLEETSDEEETRSNELSSSEITEPWLATLSATSLEISTVNSVEEEGPSFLLKSSSSTSASVASFANSLVSREKDGYIPVARTSNSASLISNLVSQSSGIFQSKLISTGVPVYPMSDDTKDDGKEKGMHSFSKLSTTEDLLLTSFDQSTLAFNNVQLLPGNQRTLNSETSVVVNSLIDEKTSISLKSAEFTGKLTSNVITTTYGATATCFRNGFSTTSPTPQEPQRKSGEDVVTSDSSLATSYLGEIFSLWGPSSGVNSFPYDILPLSADSGMTSAAPPILSSCKCHFLRSPDNATAATAWQRAARQSSRLVQALTVNKDNVSSLKRRKISVPDGRLSATPFGVIVTAVCALPVLLIMVTDILGVCVRTRSPWGRMGAATSRRDAKSREA